MMQTRKIFLMNKYDPPCDEILASKLNFKGLTIFLRKNISLEDLVNVFKHNKSALCISSTLPGNFSKKAIIVNNLDPTSSKIISDFQSIAEENNCDIGDHKSNSSGLSDSPTISDCAYCNCISGKNKDFSQIIYSSENFFVKATLGQFINGYLLIIPYNHIMSNAELNEYKQKEFLDVLDDICYILRLTYNTPNLLIWENGSGNSGIGKAKDSIVHSHTHIAPSNLSARYIESISGFPFKTISYNQISDYKSSSYLLIQNSSASSFNANRYDSLTWKICQDDELYIPRQYIRQLLAQEYRIPGEAWNWRTHHFEEKMKETDNQIITALKDNWHFLPQRIKDHTEDYILF